jgi:SagB-type dehydrogenase family enzyme
LDALTDRTRVSRYHDGTKHHFNRFAPSLGYLDWASQPRPFRAFDGAPVYELFPVHASTEPFDSPLVTYDRLLVRGVEAPVPITAASLGYMLRHALGLSAWKVFKGARWSLRVNPSSGNLHPTEAYVIAGPLAAFGATPGVWHYAPDRHVLERRCAFEREAWRFADPADACLVALTSIHWRESWKYGERAFRYCQHDLGHAIAALGMSAALCGWRVSMLPAWPHQAVAALTGIDRDADYVEAEREEPACLLLVTRGSRPDLERVAPTLLDAVRGGRWFGRASQLSEEHVRWSFIDDVASATEDPGRTTITAQAEEKAEHLGYLPSASSAISAIGVDRRLDAARLLLQRRSSVALDGASSTTREAFLGMLSRTLPRDGAPWQAMWWSPRIHLALFVHRVDGLAPGLYLFARADSALPRLRAAFNPEFAWTAPADGLPLWLLQAGDYRSRSQRVSCDQEIAADGFFSLGMIADFDASLDEYGPPFYRNLFWESGVVGQMLYLEAEAAGARGTGIGCFFDDPMHQLLGVNAESDHAFQSLYHFTVGMPVEDTRLTTEPGYPV